MTLSPTSTQGPASIPTSKMNEARDVKLTNSELTLLIEALDASCGRKRKRLANRSVEPTSGAHDQLVRLERLLDYLTNIRYGNEGLTTFRKE
jgi:hypothetical protein